jgi:hypothetical protein
MALFPIQSGGITITSPLTIPLSSSLFGTHLSHYGVGGYAEFPSSSFIYDIPVNVDAMNSDGWSSGRRKFGMIVYDMNGKKFYQLRPKLSGSNTEVSASQFAAAIDAQKIVWLDPTETAYDDDYFPVYGSGNPAEAWTEVFAPLSINNNTNNYVLTATGNSGSVNGEQNFTFDGTTLVLTGSLSVSGSINAQSFFQNSSRTLKTNITPFETSAINLLDSVSVVEFNYLNDLTNKHIGFIAEDTPVELSTLNQNVMDTNSTVGVLIKAVQELTQKVKELESKLK